MSDLSEVRPRGTTCWSWASSPACPMHPDQTSISTCYKKSICTAARLLEKPRQKWIKLKTFWTMRVGLQLHVLKNALKVRPPFKAKHAVRKNKHRRALCRLLTGSLSQAGIQQLSSKSHGLLGKLSSKRPAPGCQIRSRFYSRRDLRARSSAAAVRRPCENVNKIAYIKWTDYLRAQNF